jgi:hypothetical protein
MTLAQLAEFWDGHGTKILGALAFIVSSALLVEGLIPDAHIKYWIFANMLLGGGTVKRGFTNSSKGTPSA